MTRPSLFVNEAQHNGATGQTLASAVAGVQTSASQITVAAITKAALLLKSPIYRALALTLTAAVVNVTVGVEDIVALAPFVARAHTRVGKLSVIVVYIFTVSSVVATAVAISLRTQALVADGRRSEVTVKWYAGCSLLVYSACMAISSTSRHMFASRWSSEVKSGSIATSALTGQKPQEENITEESEGAMVHVAKRVGPVMAVSALVSVNDITVYVVLATSGVYEWYELILGTALGCMFLSIITLWVDAHAGSVPAAVSARVPLWAVTAIAGVYFMLSAHIARQQEQV